MTTFSNVGAPSARTISWKLINWDTVNTHVRRLQLRIAKAIKQGRYCKALDIFEPIHRVLANLNY